jgi:hypothetical protein
MNDAQTTINLLERIELLLQALAAELKAARMARGPVEKEFATKVYMDTLRQVAIVMEEWERKRTEFSRGPDSPSRMFSTCYGSKLSRRLHSGQPGFAATGLGEGLLGSQRRMPGGMNSGVRGLALISSSFVL